MASTNIETFFRCKDFEDAKTRSLGYQDNELIENLVKKNKKNPPWKDKNKSFYLDHRQLELCSALMWIICENKYKKIRVSDVGGGNGYLFFSCKKHIPNINWSWKVFESNKIAKAYLQFEKESGIKWENSDAELLENGEVALFSCSLQYLEFPFQTLKKYSFKHKYLIITRVPFVEDEKHIITTQSLLDISGYKTKNTSWPAWFFQRKQFINEIKKLGNIIYQWETPTEVILFEGKSITLEGMLISCY
jgi:putative methyltransferase (TIGR04325 family)